MQTQKLNGPTARPPGRRSSWTDRAIRRVQMDLSPGTRTVEGLRRSQLVCWLVVRRIDRGER